ncbi:MAG TPA: FAD binding domain-containing protein, partial [Candidatus Cloacimonas sp.]|nr:FAD binding domain-containing protein [Candidatus Cloacimonas sp.]
MSLAHEFAYYKPLRLEEALSLKQQYGNKANILAGGTDLIVNIREGVLKPDLL